MARLVTVPTLNVNDAISDAYVDALTGNVNYLSVAGADLAALGVNNTLTITAEFHVVTLATGNVDNIADAAGLTKGQQVRLMFSNSQTIRNNGGPGGNIRTLSGGDTLVPANAIVPFVYDGALWRELGRVVGDLDYAQITAPVTLGAATVVVTGASVAYDGVTPVTIEFYCPSFEITSSGTGAVQQSDLKLYQDGSDIGYMAMIKEGWVGGWVDPGAYPVMVTRKMTPAAGNHTYSIRGNGAAGVVKAGAGGAGAYMPAYLRIKRA